ncbi:Receptor expression-enhancing protein 6 [Echinococcus granulosus]|nr:Receptor expression-enhancing protein 6 [Echinococcus granulosus]
MQKMRISVQDMEYINKARDSLNKKLREKNAFTDALGTIQDKTGVKKEYIVYGLIALITLYLMVGWGATFLANFIGFIYPAYCSIKAIESPCKDDDTKWLTYWVVYAAFALVETFTDLCLYWIPLYALQKCIFLIYLMIPGNFNGSVLLYNKFIRPYILKYENDIDRAADEVGKFVDKVWRSVLQSDVVCKFSAHYARLKRRNPMLLRRWLETLFLRPMNRGRIDFSHFHLFNFEVYLRLCYFNSVQLPHLDARW